MAIKNYKPRLIDPIVKNNLQAFGAVCIEGPKWCGKTWTSLHHSNSSFLLGDPQGGFQNRQLAELSPDTVLEGETPRLLDEWQEVPLLWDAVRHEVDNRNKTGQFLLTGSSTPNYKGVLHSGAGRIASLRMRPMSLFESGESSGTASLAGLVNKAFKPHMVNQVDLDHLLHLIIRGGWPASLSVPQAHAHLIPQQYIHAIVEDDIHRLDDIPRDKTKFQSFLKSLARNESTTASLNTLVRDITQEDKAPVDPGTASTYQNILKRIFFMDNIPPFKENIRSRHRIKGREKRQLCDPSLAAALIGATSGILKQDLNTLGFLFESLCARDMKIYAQSLNANIYHYQDYDGNEVDLILEMPDGAWFAFEIKLGANQVDQAAASLQKFKNLFSSAGSGRAPSGLGVICGLANAAYQREDGVFVLPITALGP